MPKKELLATAVLILGALSACGDDGGDACTDEYVATCESDYATCLENLDHTSPDYPDLSQACYDTLCACLEDADCEGTGFNCNE